MFVLLARTPGWVRIDSETQTVLLDCTTGEELPVKCAQPVLLDCTPGLFAGRDIQ